MITIPTTELIGCLADVLPIISDEKNSLAGVRIAWDGEALHFTTYDVYTGGTVEWVPGEGAEGEIQEDKDGNPIDDDIEWGATENELPWAVWIWLPQVKEIVKLFKLPAKLWRFPVTLKCSPTGDRLTIEREDGPKAGRLLMLNTSNNTLRHIPNVRAIAHQTPTDYPRKGIRFVAFRLGAFGTVRPHGTMLLDFGTNDEPVGVHIGSRFHGFIYPAGAKNVRTYNVLRDGAGVVTKSGEWPDGGE